MITALAVNNGLTACDVCCAPVSYLPKVGKNAQARKVLLARANESTCTCGAHVVAAGVKGVAARGCPGLLKSMDLSCASAPMFFCNHTVALQ
jgi:hypothetical protein